MYFWGTHRSPSNCTGNCASGPSGNPLCICTLPRRAALYRQSREPPGSGKLFGKRRVDRKRRNPTSAAPSSPASLARRSCNKKKNPVIRKLKSVINEIIYIMYWNRASSFSINFYSASNARFSYHLINSVVPTFRSHLSFYFSFCTCTIILSSLQVHT